MLMILAAMRPGPPRLVTRRLTRFSSTSQPRQPARRSPRVAPGARPNRLSGKPPQSETDLPGKLPAVRILPLLGAGAVALALGLYIGRIIPSLLSASESRPDSAPTGRPPGFTGDIAEKFDRSLDLPEWLGGITNLRGKLTAEARGHVLEVAVGTGRNMSFYRWGDLSTPESELEPQIGRWQKPPFQRKMLSFTGLDISVDMLNVALQKLSQNVPAVTAQVPVVSAPGDPATSSAGEISYLSGKLRLVQSDAQQSLPSRPGSAGPGDKYDTIVQTFGLCSVSDPILVLTNMAAAVQPNEGRIILLEHGKGTWDWFNGYLDEHAPAHFHKFGCWWNRDIEHLIRQAADRIPGLEIIKMERPYLRQMGTTLYIELRVRDDAG